VAVPADGRTVTSLVLGIASVVFFWVPGIGMLIGIIGAVMAGMSLRRASSVIGIAGLATSLVGIALGALTTYGVIYALLIRT
jgi:hypothetical protein